MTALVAVTVDKPGDLCPGLGFGGEMPAGKQLPLQIRVETFRSGVDAPIDRKSVSGGLEGRFGGGVGLGEELVDLTGHVSF